MPDAGAVPLHLALQGLSFGAEALQGIRDLQEYARARSANAKAPTFFADVVASTLGAGLITETEAEASMLRFMHTGKEEDLAPFVDQAIEQAAALFGYFGFKLPPVAGDGMRGRVQLDYGRSCAELLVWSYDMLDLTSLTWWADVPTRRAVVKAIEALRGAFWNSIFVADLHENSHILSELNGIAERASKRQAWNMDALWEDAIGLIDNEEVPGNNGEPVVRLWGIGTRADFDVWMEDQITLRQQHRAFLSANPTQFVWDERCKKLRSWARRARGLAEAARREVDHCAEVHDHRDPREQLLILTGPRQEAIAQHYFDFTNDESGEVPGLVIDINLLDGEGFVEAMVVALAGTAVFTELRGLLR